MLTEKLEELLGSGVTALTVTINAVQRTTAERLYQWAYLHGRRERGHIAALPVLERQWAGLAAATEAGLLVKVNSVLVPGVNEEELVEVARRAGKLGVARHNIMPLLPRGLMRGFPSPDPRLLERVRAACEPHLTQFRGCQQCQADVIAPPTSLTEGVSRARAFL